jgi:hypothetical protein
MYSTKAFKPFPILLLALSAAVSGISGCAGPAQAPAGADKALQYGERRIASLRNVALAGQLGARYEAATRNLLARKDRYSLESFRASAMGVPGTLWPDWPGDQVGRWLSVLHVAEAHGWPGVDVERRQVLDAALPHLNERGHFGPSQPFDHKDGRITSGNAFALRGLADAYEDGGDARCLAAARRLRDYYAATFPTWAAASDGKLHEFWGHCLDGLVKLHELSGDSEALALARRIAATAGRTGHTHHSLSLYRGMVDLHRVTGDPDCLARARDYLSWCAENRIVTGGLPEAMPSSPQDEGCALADYVVLNLMMFAATGKDWFLHDAEHVLVNHFFMNQFHTGGFGHRGFAEDVIGGKGWQGWDGKFGSENPGCCSLWGQWALGQVGRYAVTRRGRACEVNLFAEVTVEFPEDGLKIAIAGDFPRMSEAKITFVAAGSGDFAVRLRVPLWAGGMAVRLNGSPVETALDDGFRVVIDRSWSTGDVLSVNFTGAIRAVRWQAAGPSRWAVFDGPLCLALSSANADVGRPWSIAVDQHATPIRDAQGRFQLSDGQATSWLPLEPVADDWTNPDVNDPHRLRILFGEAGP